MKKLITISLNLILVMGFLNLISQNETTKLENNKAFKKELLTDSQFDNANQFPLQSRINQKSNRAIVDYGSTPDLNWKEQFGGSGNDYINAVTSDENGNIFITGSFSGQMTLSGNNYTSTGNREAFIAKLDNSGNLIWLTQIPASENNETNCIDICIDAVGYLYVTGYYTGLITVGESSLPDINNYSLFYAKLNNQGELLNGAYHSQDINETGYSIDVDNNANVYIISAIANYLDYRHASWLLKYDQSNNLIRENQYQIGFNNLVVSGSNIYYSGVIQYGDDGYLDENVSITPPLGYSNVFVTKSNLDGIFEWGYTASNDGSFGHDSGNDQLIIDNQGNFFMAGTYRNSLVIGNDTITTNDYNSGFITKFDPQGNFMWLEQYNSSKVKLSSDINGNAYITGVASLLKYDANGTMLWETELENQPNAICLKNDQKIINAGSNNGLNYVTQLDNEAAEEWTTQFEGNSALGYVIGMVTDDNGNIYTYNYTSGTIDYFGETVNEGIFICKQKGQGEVVWIKQFADVYVNYGYGNHIAIDPSNENIYITGYFNDELTIPEGTPLIPSDEGSVFIIKYDVNGSYKWSLQEDFYTSGLCLVADYANNIILGGTFNETISINGTELVSAGSQDCFIAKYGSDANLVWAIRAGGESTEYIGLVSVDGNNNVYLTGEFTSINVTVDETPITLNEGDGNVLFTKLNADGAVQWVKSFAATHHEWYDGYCWPTGIKTDTNGYTYLKGSHRDTAYFDNILLTNPYNQYSKFIAKIDSYGNAVWAKTINQHNSGYSYDYNQFDIDNEGSVYFGVQARDTLFFGDDFQYNPTSICDLFVAKYSTDGNLDWVKTMQGNEYSYSWISSVAVYNTTNVFVGGFFNNYLSIDNEVLTSANRHGFVSMFGDDISGVNDVYNSVSVFIYPSPAADKISISSGLSLQNAELNIFSISGKLIKTETIKDQNEIDVSNLQSGTYIIKIYTGKSVLVSKFIKL